MPNRDKVLMTQAVLSILGLMFMVGIAARALRSTSEAIADRPDANNNTDGASLQFKAPTSSQTDRWRNLRAPLLAPAANSPRSHLLESKMVSAISTPANRMTKLEGKSGPDTMGPDTIMTGTIVKRGSELVLLDRSGAIFHLNMPERALQFEGANVRVKGTLATSNQMRVTELVPAGPGY